MARVPKELFTQFQDHLNNEQEIRDVSVRMIRERERETEKEEKRRNREKLRLEMIFSLFCFPFLKEIRTIMKEIDTSVRDAMLALQIIHTSLTGGM